MVLMRTSFTLVLAGALLFGCGDKRQPEAATKTTSPIVGTWRLRSGTLIEKGDTTVTDYTKGVSFIKIINDTHFAFLKHSLGKGSPASYDSGGGRYSLTDSAYTEHLEYCNEREWEGNAFNFTVTFRKDTLIQQGIEHVEQAGINRLNIEKYVRLTN